MSDEQQPKPEDVVEEQKTSAGEQQEHEVEVELAESVDEAQSKIDSLSEQLVEAKDHVLRSHAEAQNARRRADQDVEKAHKFGQEKLVADLLPVVDNLERALASIDQENETLKSIIEGIELTLKSFSDTLVKHKVEVIDPVGEPFDPQFHQAMTMIPSPDAEPNSVIEVFQKGYTLHGRLVRPAMVVVSKAP